MNGILSRLNAYFAFAVTVLAFLTICCFLSTATNTHDSNITLGTGKVVVRSARDINIGTSVNDLGIVTLDIKGDLTDLFNWNVKQLFIYLSAEYKTKDHAVNQVVLWDKIIRRGQDAKLNLQNLNTKYYFWDFGQGLLGNENVTLTLNWNVIPNAGRLDKAVGTGSHAFSFPTTYIQSRS